MSDTAPLKGIRKGLLEFAVLTTIAAQKVYAADIRNRLETTEFATQEGTLYPLLSKLRRDGLVDYEWVESESGPPRKYYELTTDGTSRLEALRSYWHMLTATFSDLEKAP